MWAVWRCHRDMRRTVSANHLREIRPCSLWAYDNMNGVLGGQYLFNLATDRIGRLAF